MIRLSFEFSQIKHENNERVDFVATAKKILRVDRLQEWTELSK